MEVISQDLNIQEMENETYTNPDLLLFFRTQIFYKFLYEQKKSILTFRLKRIFRLRAYNYFYLYKMPGCTCMQYMKYSNC